MQSAIKNACVVGKLKMVAAEFQTASKVLKNRNAAREAESGGFVLWQMNPGMWYVELAVGASKVHAGCNGELVWRHTPWLGAHTAKGPVRPLRRALQVRTSNCWCICRVIRKCFTMYEHALMLVFAFAGS